MTHTVPRLLDALELRIEMVGGKAASLARLAGGGFPVPDGFVITTEAYRQAIEAPRVARELARLADGANAGPGDAERVRRAMIEAPPPQAIANAIAAAYAALGSPGEGAGVEVPVAVRSSATAEDLPDASFAGQQDTFLNVRGIESVLAAVRRCWASLWSDRAIAYRAERHIDPDRIAIAVVVQRMVEAEVAGVLFTANPVNHRRDEVVIEASWGLGESVVSGRVTPDTFVVRPFEGRVHARRLGDKAVATVYAAEGGVRETEPDRPAAACLTDAQAVELAELGRRVEAFYGAPQDIEWALAGGALQLLQSRPITTLADAATPDPHDHWTRRMFTEILPDGPSPVFNSVLRPVLSQMLSGALDAWGFRPAAIPACATFYSQPYLNLRFIEASLASLPPRHRHALAARMADPFAAPEHAEQPSRRVSLATLRLMMSMLRASIALRRRLPGTVERYYAGLRPYHSGAMAGQSDAELTQGLEHVALSVVPPIIADDFLLIASLGLAHRLLAASVSRSGVKDQAAVIAALLSGVTGNVTMETNKALWSLAGAARASAQLAAGIREVARGSEPLDSLSGRPGGRAFLEQLDGFLQRYGHREVRMDIVYPTWGEDPRPVLGFVASYLEGGEDPALREQAAAARRAAAAEAVRAGLRGSLAGRLVWRRLFDWAYGMSLELGSDRDTMHFHVTACFPPLRALLLELGSRWAAEGRLDRPDDIFMLEVDEIARRDDLADLAGLARRRRATWERERRGPWPAELISGQPVYDDGGASEARDGSLSGTPGSPGLGHGRARLVADPEDFGSLRPGEILVAPHTNPAWTPLFAIAAGLVTEAGGILSHGAIVAREYGIPAVVGVPGAMRLLENGQRVTVDGTRGEVTPEPVHSDPTDASAGGRSASAATAEPRTS